MSRLPSSTLGGLLLPEPLCKIPRLRNRRCPIAISGLFLSVSGLKAGQLQSSQAFKVQATLALGEIWDPDMWYKLAVLARPQSIKLPQLAPHGKAPLVSIKTIPNCRTASKESSEWGFPGGASAKEPMQRYMRVEFDPWVRKISWRKAWQPTPGFLPGESHRQRSLAG